eukprot:3990886-Prymnesium_polylepis.1
MRADPAGAMSRGAGESAATLSLVPCVRVPRFVSKLHTKQRRHAGARIGTYRYELCSQQRCRWPDEEIADVVQP